MTEDRKRKVRRRAAWLAHRFVMGRQKAGTLFCDLCSFDPVERLKGLSGFISQQQALARRNRTAEQIAEEVDGILSADSLTSAKLKLAKEADHPKASTMDDEIPF